MLTPGTLQTIRAHSGMSMADLATKAGVSLAALAEFESGERQLQTGTVIALMKVLDVQVLWIVGDMRISGP